MPDDGHHRTCCSRHTLAEMILKVTLSMISDSLASDAQHFVSSLIE
jgi:hypothetical protein